MGDYGFDLGSFEDLDFADFVGGSYGGGFDLSSLQDFGFDLSNIQDLGLGSLDLGGLNFDMGGLDLGGVDLSNLGNLADIIIGPEITGGDVALVDLLNQPTDYGFGNISDEVYQGAILSDPYAIDQLTSRDEFTFGQGLQDPYEVDQQTTRNEFTFGQGLQDPFEVDQQTTRNEFTFGQGLQDPFEVDQQTTRDEFTFGQGLEDPFEVDGRQGSRTEDTATKGQDDDRTKPDGTQCPEGYVYDPATKQCKKATTDTKQCPDGYTYDPVSKQCVKSKTTTPPVITKDNALLMALLGGLLGLLSKGSAPKGPVGYQGGIPRYTATRGQAMAPTAGGRRPGGAGIPSLTGGVTYQSAAQGGLMGMAEGGRAARYLRGGTDGMADKIQTNIDGKQPARLSHGEFVIPADVVSHLGNGNSDAGADVLYDMMDKIRKARTGTTKQGKQINPRKYTPA